MLPLEGLKAKPSPPRPKVLCGRANNAAIKRSSSDINYQNDLGLSVRGSVRQCAGNTGIPQRALKKRLFPARPILVKTSRI